MVWLHGDFLTQTPEKRKAKLTVPASLMHNERTRPGTLA
jgi:hypothetical protein